MRDYSLNHFFFEMQKADVRSRYAADPKGVMDAFRLSPQAQLAVRVQDMAFLAARTNPYLLRFYFGYIGMSDADFIAAVRATASSAEGARG